jgi:hypothetical protein
VSGEAEALTPEEEAVKTPRMPPELLKALTDCIAAFQECSGELRLTREAFVEHQEKIERRLDDQNEIILRVEGLVNSCDAGVKGLRLLIDKDYVSLRDELIAIKVRVEGTKELAASAYDIGESLTRKLRLAGIINGDEARRPTKSGGR